MSNILITGASGNVGRYVAQFVIKNKQGVKVAGTRIHTLKEMYQDTATIVYFDFMDSSTFQDALHGVDCIFMMRPPHLGKPEDLKPFIDAIKEKGGIQLVCFLSLLGVEHNPIPPHHKIEKYIEQAKLPFCHIRPSFFMQNLSGVHAYEIKHFSRIVVPVKNACTSFIDAQDIGELCAKVLCEPQLHHNTSYSITGSQALNYWQVAEIFSNVIGRDILYSNPKPSFAKTYWTTVRGLDQTYCSVMTMLYWMTRMGGAKKVTTVFEDIMGKKPQTFEQFVKRNIACW